jgi:hypothetical protein
MAYFWNGNKDPVLMARVIPLTTRIAGFFNHWHDQAG